MIVQRLFAADIEESCGVEPSAVCEYLADRIESVTVVRVITLSIGWPARIALIVAVTWVVGRLVKRAIRRFGDRAVEQHADRQAQIEASRRQHGVEIGEGTSPSGNRSGQRIATMVSVVASLAGVVVWSVGLLVILGEFDVNVAPLLAGAGVVGIALGFGAQSIVADFLAGMFMLAEDQYGVGDVVDLGEATGVVEEFSLRTTTLRDIHGTVWHVPNSQILRVANKSQFWSRAVLDIEVAYDTDLRRAEGIIQRVADDLWQDTEFTEGTIIDPPEVWGVELLGPSGVTIRVVLKTDPAEQWVVARELRLRIKEALDEAGIEIPFPQQTVWIQQAQPSVPRDQRPEVPTADLRHPKVTEDLSINPH